MQYRTACALLVFVLSFSRTASADVFYRETFDFCELVTGRPSAAAVAGWHAITSGHPEGKPSILKIQPVGAASRLPAVNSDPEGPADGNAFWARPSKGLLIYTGEISFDVSVLRAVSWKQRIDRGEKRFPQYGARLALLINGVWYISDHSAMQETRGIFERVEVAPFSLTYGTVPANPSVGPEAPANAGVTLPDTGTVEAFGIFMQRSFGKVRIDDFTLIDASSDSSHRADRTFERCTEGSDPTPPPISDPDESNDVCSAATVNVRGFMHAKGRKKLLRSVRGTTIQRARDRALLSLATTGLPLDWLAQLTPSSLVGYKRKFYLVFPNATLFPISRATAQDIWTYIVLTRLYEEPNDPLFRYLSAAGAEEPLCGSGIFIVLAAYAQYANLLPKLIVY